MSRPESTWIMVALLLSVGATACNREATPPIENATTDGRTNRSDSEIATEVQGRFYADDLVRPAGIDVEVNDGVVTLTGSAQNEQMRERALGLARTVDGVVRVQDQLATAQAAQAGASRPGTTQGADERTTTTQQDARATTGASDEPAPGARPIAGDVTPNPAWITTQIQARYFMSPAVKPWNVDVTTRSGGIVELAGEVENTEARQEAVRIAREIEGVTRVEDQLRVRGESGQQTAAADRSTGETTLATGISDVWITTKVQSKFYLDDNVRGRDIDVETENAVVTLTGTVESMQERRQAVALARNTDGVMDVQDRLQVGASSGRAEQDQRLEATSGRVADAIEDTWITTKIQSQYFLDRLVKGHEIDVDTQNGVVTLKGSVESDAEKQVAEDIARGTEGVSKVANQLTVVQ